MRFISQESLHSEEGAEPRTGESKTRGGVGKSSGKPLGGTTLKGPTGWPTPRAEVPSGSGPARLSGAPALGRPTGSPRGFKPPPPEGAQPIGSSRTTVTSAGPERQLLGGALSSPRLPRRPDPTNSTSDRDPNSRPAASSSPTEISLRDGTDAPRPSCAARVRGARRGRTGGWRGRAEPASLRVRPRTRRRDHLRLAPRARPGRAPTHPSRARAGRARTRASLLPRPSSYPSFRLAL